VGKTRLAQEVTLEARDRGFLVATGRCYEPDRTVPFYPFRDALATAFAAAPPALRAEMPRRWPYLQRLLPDRLAAPLPASSDPQDDQQRLFRAVTGFVQAASLHLPVALMLDDLHWADASSLELLHQLTRETRGYRVLLLGTYRDVDVGRGHPLERALRDLTREHLVEVVAVRRLDEKGTAALVGATLGEPDVPPELASLVHRRTDGNPFFIQEVVRALVERGDIYRRDGAWEQRDAPELGVPASVRSAVAERLSRLDDRTQETLHMASALGQAFDFQHLQVVAGIPEVALERALEEALSVGLIRETVGDLYAFSHALAQQALYADLSARRRRKLHLAAAEALERLRRGQDRAAELAWHYLKADDPARALPFAMLAGDQAEKVFAHAEAEQHYRMSLELVQTVKRPGERPAGESLEAEALTKLGGVLRTLARNEEALEVLERAAALYAAADDMQSQLRVVAEVGFVHHAMGSSERGIARIQQLLQRLEEPAASRELGREEAAVHIPLAHLFLASGEYEQSLIATQRAAELARSAGDNQILARAEAVHGDALRLLGRQAEAMQALEKAISAADVAGDADTLFLALDALAALEMSSGELRRCKLHRRQAVEVVERLDERAKIAFEVACLGEITFCLGEWDEAAAHFERAMDLTPALGVSWVTAHAFLHRGMYRRAKGDWRRARQDLEEAARLCETVDRAWLTAAVQGALAELDLLEGLPRAALARLNPLLDHPGLAESKITPLLPLLAWAQLEVGDEVGAEETVAGVPRPAAKHHDRLALAEALRVQGMISTRQKRWAEAAHAFEQAISLTHAMPFPYGEARALHAYGLMHLRNERRDLARVRLNEALTLFRRLGASKDEERAARAIGEPDRRSN
jgi:predicted ATPase